jgi:serine/threonine protein kinase
VNPPPQLEEGIFQAALNLAAEQRPTYLEEACGEDAGLRRRVDALLGAFERAGGFMKEPAVPAWERGTVLAPTERPGDRIGRYKILEQIGEGGCGVVYMAEQYEPVRRRVALKLIRLGLETRDVVTRFEAERQALAMMDHPNIARVFDGGATESGRPYFVMELVRGTPITRYCDEHRLSTRERLALFVQVCQAVQHAHQKGIIHRDIKPSNVLVTELDGRPATKVIDFGVAKATEQRLTEKTLFTRFGQIIGTPAYMSPEQAGFGGLDIDTRSDVYSLGVLLYELLTGRAPFDSKKLLEAGYEKILQTIR